jgi:Holliday junction resolvasome RuvABC endonuclease subunit
MKRNSTKTTDKQDVYEIFNATAQTYTERTVVLALDPATEKTGYAIFTSDNNEIIAHNTIKAKLPKGITERNTDNKECTIWRIHSMITEIEKLISKYHVTHIVSENIFESDKDIFEVLARLKGAIAEMSIKQLNRVPKYIDPILAKTHIWHYNSKRKLSRAEHKARMINHITNRYGYTLNSKYTNKDDEADAIGILITYLEKRKHIAINHPLEVLTAFKARS